MLDPYFSDTTEWEEVIKGGYQQRGYHQERQNGHGRGRWRDREDPRLRRDDSIERRYNAPPSATSINATSFILCLSLYVRNIIEPIKEELQNLECFVKISKWLSWLVRIFVAYLTIFDTERTFSFSRIYAAYQQLSIVHCPSRPNHFHLRTV